MRGSPVKWRANFNAHPPLPRRAMGEQNTMPLFWKPYKSDVTSFIEELKAKKPSLEAEQRQGRALRWEKLVDRQAQIEFLDAKVPQQPYVYGSRHG